MAITVVATTSKGGTAGSTTVSDPINTTGATLIEVTAVYYQPNGVASLTDSKGNTWTPLTPRNVSGMELRKWYANPLAGQTGAGHTFTLTNAVACPIFVRAYAGNNLAFVGESGTTTGTVTACSVGTVTPPASQGLVTTVLAWPSATSAQSVSGGGLAIFSQVAWVNAVTYGAAAADEIQATATARNPAWSWTTGATVDAVAAAYYEGAPADLRLTAQHLEVAVQPTVPTDARVTSIYVEAATQNPAAGTEFRVTQPWLEVLQHRVVLEPTADIRVTALHVEAATINPFAGTAVAVSAQHLEVLVAATAIVPDVIGMTLAEATAVLAAAGFPVGTVTGAGIVVDQNPDGGTAATPGTPVDLVLDPRPNLLNPGDQSSVEDETVVSLQLVATSLSPRPFTYGASGLPPGLSLDPATGLITGTPSLGSAGTYPVTITATVDGFTDTELFTWVVVPLAPIEIWPAVLPEVLTDQPYVQQLTATGGHGGPYVFDLIAGALPPGLTLAPDGLITGSTTGSVILGPTAWPMGVVDVFYSEQLVLTDHVAPADYTFTVRATDWKGSSGTRVYTLHVAEGWSDAVYSIVAVLGPAPACLTVTSNGLIRGYPMTVGIFTFTVQAQNAAGLIVTLEVLLKVRS